MRTTTNCINGLPYFILVRKQELQQTCFEALCQRTAEKIESFGKRPVP
jgi:hypothetical protein